MRGGAATQNRAVARRQDSSQVGRLDGWCAVANAVDAAVLAQQRAGTHPRADLAPRHTGPEQLRPSDHPVLSAGDPSELPFDCPVQGTDLVP